MLNQRESDALNMLRWSSTFAIVLCHLQQALDNDWCWVFNVGVQVFFFLSGFLYGGKRIDDVKMFYKGRLRKLYLPYALWVTVAMLMLFFFGGVNPEPWCIVKEYATISHHTGLSHLWFMMVLFICYLILPIVDRFARRNVWITAFVLSLSLIALIAVREVSLYVWVALYYVGYFCGHSPKIQPFVFGIAVFGAVAIAYTLGLSFELWRNTMIIGNIFHSCVGIVLSLGVFFVLRNIQLRPSISHILTNGGGYEIYLTHHLFILGPLSLVFFTSCLWLNIVILLIVTIVCSFVLYKISAYWSKLVHKTLALY